MSRVPLSYFDVCRVPCWLVQPTEATVWHAFPDIPAEAHVVVVGYGCAEHEVLPVGVHISEMLQDIVSGGGPCRNVPATYSLNSPGVIVGMRLELVWTLTLPL